MSGTDIFPVLTDELIDDYRRGATDAERAQMEEWLGVERVIPAVREPLAARAGVPRRGRLPGGVGVPPAADGFQPDAACHGGPASRQIRAPRDVTRGRLEAGAPSAWDGAGDTESRQDACSPLERTRRGRRKHVVSATLFWKMVLGSDPDLPPPTRERLVMARRMGLVKRFSPWSSYVEPLLDYSAQAMERHPDVEFRLHLARDLDFLVEDFTRLGWNVHLMKSPSLRYCPGGFWRFLALEDARSVVTVIDTDRMNVVDGEIARTRMMDDMGLGLWRVPGYHGADNTGRAPDVRYRPILGGHFGGRGGLPVREWLEAFIWHARRGTLPVMANMPGRGQVPIHRVDWPDYGFDEWFQLAALYPRMVPRGTLTFVPTDSASMLLPVDIEYVMWANRRSEIVYF